MSAVELRHVRVCLVSTSRMMKLDEHDQDTLSQLHDELDEALRAVENGTARVRTHTSRTPLGYLDDELLQAYMRFHHGELRDLVQAQHDWLIDKGVLSDRRRALSTLRTELVEAIARDYVDAQLIDRYVDALPGWAARPGYCRDQVDLWVRRIPATCRSVAGSQTRSSMATSGSPRTRWSALPPASCST